MDTKKVLFGAILAGLAVWVITKVARAAGGKVSPCPPAGDVDGDGWITSKDSQMIGDYLAGNITLTLDQKTRGDVNGDGQVTIADALMIAQYLAGTRTTFPVCPVH